MAMKKTQTAKPQEQKPGTVLLSSIHLNDGSRGLPKNPRFIRDTRFNKLKESVKDNPEFMPARPIIVDEDGTILGGNMRFRACCDLGMIEVPESWVKVVTAWPIEKKRRFIILDNRPFGEDDFESLANEWDVPELLAAGFEEKELSGAFEEEEPTDAAPRIDEAAELNKTWNVKTGDLWLIGEHRLLCGDSTKATDVAKLLGDRKPLLMVTDPPYGVEYDADWRNDKIAGKPRADGKIGGGGSAVGKVENDGNADWRETWALFPGDVAYIWHAGVHAGTVQDSLIAAGFAVRSQIVWAKNQLVIGRGDYHQQHEPCWYCVRNGKPGLRTDDRKQTTLWQIDKPQKSETGHSTQKPLECMARPMRNHHANEVYDPFLGSGTTMVAAQNLCRKCYGTEISPDYCAVILQRMKDAFPDIEIRKESPA